MIIDIETGHIHIRDARPILGTAELTITPARAREIAAELDAEGRHTVVAEGLRRAARQAETPIG